MYKFASRRDAFGPCGNPMPETEDHVVSMRAIASTMAFSTFSDSISAIKRRWGIVSKKVVRSVFATHTSSSEIRARTYFRQATHWSVPRLKKYRGFRDSRAENTQSGVCDS